jgi:hypothetical protein
VHRPQPILDDGGENVRGPAAFVVVDDQRPARRVVPDFSDARVIVERGDDGV